MPAEYLVISLSILNKGKNEREKLNIWSCLTYSSPKFYWLVPDTQVERERERELFKGVLDKTEAATRGVLLKKMFLAISQNSKEKTSARAFF